MSFADHFSAVAARYAAFRPRYPAALIDLLAANADPNSEDAPLLSQTELLRAKPLTKRGLVNAGFKGAPLAEVLDAIAEQTGANVALSPALPNQVRQTPVTVRFANAPVRLVAISTSPGSFRNRYVRGSLSASACASPFSIASGRRSAG